MEALLIMLGIGVVWVVLRLLATKAAVARDVEVFGTTSLGFVDGLLAEQQRLIDEAIEQAADRDRPPGNGENLG